MKRNNQLFIRDDGVISHGIPEWFGERWREMTEKEIEKLYGREEPKTEFDVNTASRKDLIDYAEANEIEIDKRVGVENLRRLIKEGNKEWPSKPL